MKTGDIIPIYKLAEVLYKARCRTSSSSRYVEIPKLKLQCRCWSYEKNRYVWENVDSDLGIGFLAWGERSFRYRNRAREYYYTLILQEAAEGRATRRIAPKKWDQWYAAATGTRPEATIGRRPRKVYLNHAWTLLIHPDGSARAGCQYFSREKMQEVFEELGAELGYEVEK